MAKVSSFFVDTSHWESNLDGHWCKFKTFVFYVTLGINLKPFPSSSTKLNWPRMHVSVCQFVPQNWCPTNTCKYHKMCSKWMLLLAKNDAWTDFVVTWSLESHLLFPEHHYHVVFSLLPLIDLQPTQNSTKICKWFSFVIIEPGQKTKMFFSFLAVKKHLLALQCFLWQGPIGCADFGCAQARTIRCKKK